MAHVCFVCNRSYTYDRLEEDYTGRRCCPNCGTGIA